MFELEVEKVKHKKSGFILMDDLHFMLSDIAQVMWIFVVYYKYVRAL